MKDFIIVAIDGAAASGKTTTAMKIATKYNFLMSSTGLYYRTLALMLLRNNIECSDLKKIKNFVKDVRLGTKILGNVSSLSVNGETFSEQDLRTKLVNDTVAEYSGIPVIRSVLINYQREQSMMAKIHGFRGLIMEGRDITSVIFPDADLRFFLEAAEMKRSLRRGLDQEGDDISARDKLDQKRTIFVDGVYKIDSGRHNLDVVVEIISRKIDEILIPE